MAHIARWYSKQLLKFSMQAKANRKCLGLMEIRRVSSVKYFVENHIAQNYVLKGNTLKTIGAQKAYMKTVKDWWLKPFQCKNGLIRAQIDSLGSGLKGLNEQHQD